MAQFGENNVGPADRAARVVLGALALYLFGINYAAAPLSYLLLVAGVVLAITGIWGSCPLYTLLKMNTCGKKK